jgi:hypothetical protein
MPHPGALILAESIRAKVRFPPVIRRACDLRVGFRRPYWSASWRSMCGCIGNCILAPAPIRPNSAWVHTCPSQRVHSNARAEFFSVRPEPGHPPSGKGNVISPTTHVRQILIRASKGYRESLPFTRFLEVKVPSESCDEQAQDTYLGRTGARVVRRDVRRRSTTAARATNGA